MCCSSPESWILMATVITSVSTKTVLDLERTLDSQFVVCTLDCIQEGFNHPPLQDSWVFCPRWVIGSICNPPHDTENIASYFSSYSASSLLSLPGDTSEKHHMQQSCLYKYYGEIIELNYTSDSQYRGVVNTLKVVDFQEVSQSIQNRIPLIRSCFMRIGTVYCWWWSDQSHVYFLSKWDI